MFWIRVDNTGVF